MNVDIYLDEFLLTIFTLVGFTVIMTIMVIMTSMAIMDIMVIMTIMDLVIMDIWENLHENIYLAAQVCENSSTQFSGKSKKCSFLGDSMKR